MSRQKKRFQSLRGQRTVFLLGHLTFFYPMIVEGKGLVDASGNPARSVSNEEIVAALKKLTIEEIMGERGEKPAMLNFKTIEIVPSEIPPV